MKLNNFPLSKLVLVLVGVCLVSMAGVAGFYHLALGKVARTASESSVAAQDGLRRSYALIESLCLAQNALQTLLRERDPDVLETLLAGLEGRQKDLAHRIDVLGEQGQAVRVPFDDWSAACKRIVEKFLRGEVAEANSELVNGLMPRGESVLAAVRTINNARDREAAERTAAMQAAIVRTRDRTIAGVGMVAGLVAAGGLVLRSQVIRGMGAAAEAMGKVTTLREANELLEERVRQRTAEIAQSNAQMEAIHETSLDCVMVLDSEWRITKFNPAAQRTFQCTEAQASGRPLSTFVQPTRTRGGESAFDGDGAAVIGKQVEASAQRLDGSTFPAELAVTTAAVHGPPIYIVSLRDLTERKRAEAEREELNNRLLTASRQAGMAEVATGVLHNVGNVLNSVNVSATMVSQTLRQSELSSLIKLGDMVQRNKHDLAAFLTGDERGRLVPDFIADVAQCLNEEHTTMLEELAMLNKGIEHIKQIISMQQSLAKKRSVLTPTTPAQVMESALAMHGDLLLKREIEVIRRFQEIEPAPLDEHRILQILINLVSNAKHAVKHSTVEGKQIILTIEKVSGGETARIRFQVADNGVGIASKDLRRIFSHGFTTKAEGHGFGLHGAANAAREMGGTLSAASDGLGKGAVFTLEVPIATNEVIESWKPKSASCGESLS